MALVFNYNDYQKTAFLSSSNAVCGALYSAQDAVGGYFHLGSANEQLAAENVVLRNQVALLQKQVALLTDSTKLATLQGVEAQYLSTSAHVINSTTNKSRNYLTIDKGEDNGIKRDMFVLNGSGVVGLVSAVSAHYATVLPLVNTSMRLSVKLKGTNYRGQLVWNSISPRYGTMVDVPEHAQVAEGDSILTSGSSSFFPEGLMVGTVREVDMDKNGGFYKLTISLAVDFSSVYDVEVVENREMQEQRTLEELGNSDTK